MIKSRYGKKRDKNLRPRVVPVNRSIILNQANKILIIKRSSDNRWSAGLWEFPGGKLEEGQDISHALEREAFEETGLIIYPKNRLAYYESFIISSGPYIGLPYIVIIGISKAHNTKVRLTNEHQDYKWISIAETKKYEMTEETERALIMLSDQLVQKRKLGI